MHTTHRFAPQCPICQSLQREGQPLFAMGELSSTFVTVPEQAPLWGYVCLVCKWHAVELYDLTPEEAAAFMQDTRRVAWAVQQATGACKLNYEIHGNTIPHLHLHLFPRYPDDVFTGAPIDPRQIIEPVYAPGECEAYRQRLGELLHAET